MTYEQASHQIPPMMAPWDVLALWVADEIYLQFMQQQTLRRIPHNGGPVSVNYNLEFTWHNAFLYDGYTYNVMAHLHVRDSQPVDNGGGIWVTGLHDTGLNWGDLDGRQYLYEYMIAYVE